MGRTSSIHGEWSSKLIFILAATGSAVGLGNIWRFPYIAGEYGGGAFVLVYLACIVFIGLPIMMAEIMIGRRGRQSPINTMATLAREEGLSRAWVLLGWLGVVVGFLILSYYSVIAGWVMSYMFRAGAGSFTGQDAETIRAMFDGLVSDPERLLAWHTIFMVMTLVVVARGVRSGLEQAVKYLMPALLAMFILLVGYAMAEGHFMEGFRFMFKPDFSRLTAEAVLVAMGQAFFSLSLGMGAIMVYGSYLNSRASIAGSSAVVVGSDTAASLLAGLAIFPIVFASGLESAQGPGLVFVTLPLAFGQMPGGLVFGTLFFVLVVIAAWTSSISIMEPAVAWLVENRNMSRVSAASVVAFLSWVLGIGTILSFNHWSAVTLFDRTFFELVDYLASSILLPLGGLLIALFAGWRMTERSVMAEMNIRHPLLFRTWYYLVRFVAPIGILLVFLRAINVI